MSLPRFDFAPHEWPPLAQGEREGLADAVFRAVWDEEGVEVAVREVRCAHFFLRFFCRLDQAQDKRIIARHNAQPLAFAKARGKRDFAERLTIAIQESFYGRAWRIETSFIGVEGVQWVYLDSDGKSGCWHGAGSGSRALATAFRLAPGSSFEQEVNDPSSDVRFALDWSRLSPFEQNKRAMNFLNGSWDELRDVVRSIAIIEEIFRVTPGVAYNEGFYYGGGMGHSNDFGSKINSRLRVWCPCIDAYFAPSLNTQLHTQHKCTQENRGLLQIALSPPTQHERLEAALFLRDWAQGKIPPDELRLLLPKL